MLSDLPKIKLTNTVILCVPYGKSSESKCKFSAKSFKELITEHLMKFEKEIERYFASLDKDELAYIRNPFIVNAQTLQTETGTQEGLVELYHNDFARFAYFEK